MKRAFIAALLGVAALVAAVPAGASINNVVAKARNGTRAFKSLDVAKNAGYGLLTDAKGIACIDNPGVGAMGVHYVNLNNVGDLNEDPAKPELLVYEPQADGSMKLVALEYVVFEDAWHQAGHTAPPRLYDRDFELVQSGNRYGLPAFYELHAWVWKDNPRGMFDDWNPNVTCAFG